MKKAIRCKHIYTSVNEELIDGYLLTEGNRICDVIPAAQFDDPQAEIIDYSEGFLMPAFNDYHVHMAMAAMMEYFGTVRATKDEYEAAQYLYCLLYTSDAADEL